MKKEKLQPTPQEYRGSFDNYEQLHANKMANLEEIEKFQEKLLEKYNLPKLNQEEIENMIRPIISNKTESVTLKLQTNRSPGPDGFT